MAYGIFIEIGFSVQALHFRNFQRNLMVESRRSRNSVDDGLVIDCLLYTSTHAICLLKNTVKITRIIISNSIYDIGDGQIRIPQIGPGSVQADAL